MNLTDDESARLAALRRLNILDTPAEKDFDDLARLAAQICETPIAVINLIDAERQWFKAKIGLKANQTPRRDSFCNQTILQTEVFVVNDAAADERFAANPLITGDLQIRFYAGAPLITDAGYALGTLCVLDCQPRQFTERQKESLTILARQIVALIQLRSNTARLANEGNIAESELRASEKRYRFLAETVPQQVWTATPDGRLDYVNRRTAEYFGLERNDRSLFGEGWLLVVHPDDIPHSIELWTRALQTGEHYENEFRLRRHDDEFRWHLAQAVPMRDAGGEIIKWFGTNTDIHERKMADETLRKSQEYKNLFEHASDAIIILSLENETILNVNERACDIYGFRREEFIGKNLKEITQNVERGEKFLQKLFERETPEEFETVHFRADGSPVHFLISASIIEYDGQAAVLTINRDVTERRRLEDRLLQTQKMESIGTLAGGVAHDFNNLLSVIMGNVQLAQLNINDLPQVERRLAEIETASNRAAALTRQLLAFSRLQPLERRTLCLNETIADTLKMLGRIIGADIEIEIRPAANLPNISADAGQIEQVIMNLVINARDAMPDGGKLIIETEEVALTEEYRYFQNQIAESCVRLTISDNGVGMTPEIRSRIFEPFFTTKEVGKGSGLGLSTIYGIVKQHEGQIEVESEPGQGATFKIYFPVEEKSADSAELPAAPVLRGGTETILIAEDEEPLRLLAQEALESLDYRVLLAKDGQECVEMYAQFQNEINLIVLDLVMPRLGGIKTCERIAEMNAAVPVIFTTGYTDKTLDENFFPVNLLREFLQKPYNVQTMGRKVREVLDVNAANTATKPLASA